MMPGIDRSGFSLVEVLIAILILSFGILALGSSTGYVLSQVQASELRSERTAAVRQAAEILGGTAWGSLETVCGDTTFTTDNYTVGCQVEASGDLKRVRLISTGPGLQDGRMVQVKLDTFAISFAQPVQ